MKREESHISLFLKSVGFIPRGFANHPIQPGMKIFMYDTPVIKGQRHLVNQKSALGIAKELEEKTK